MDGMDAVGQAQAVRYLSGAMENCPLILPQLPNVTEADPGVFLKHASRSKPLAKRALPSAVASERLAVVMRRHLSGLKPRTRGAGRYLV